MDVIQRSTLAELARESNDFAVSIFLPTKRLPTAQAEDHLRLKNLLETAESQLTEHGASTTAAREFVAPIRKAAGEPVFWEHMGDGLAIFADGRRRQVFRLAYPVAEAVHVGRRFHLVPLIDAQSDEREAHLLCVSQRHVQLWHVTPRTMDLIDAPGLPQQIEESLGFDDRQNLSRQSHGGMRHGRFDRSTSFHGQGGPSDEAKENLRQFLRNVDRALPPSVQNSEIPLVFAGVGYLYPLFAEVTGNPRLHVEYLSGNPALVAQSELQTRVLEIFSTDLAERRRGVLEQCQSQYSHLDHAPSIGEILKSLMAGEVEVLLAPRGRQFCGVFDPATLETKRFEAPRPGVEDLVNVAVHAALAHGAEILAVDPVELPPAAEMGVVYRHFAAPLAKWQAARHGA